MPFGDAIAVARRSTEARWPYTFVLALLLLVGSALWLSQRAGVNVSERQIPTPLPIGSAFDGNASLPIEEFKRHFDEGTQLLQHLQISAQHWRQIASAADWTAFSITSLVAIIAGFLGVVASPDETGLAAARAAGAEPEKRPDTTVTESSKEKKDQRRRRTALRRIGVLAACGSVVLALSAKANSAHSQALKTATELSEGLTRNRKAWFDAKSVDEAAAVIGDLEKVILQANS